MSYHPERTITEELPMELLSTFMQQCIYEYAYQQMRIWADKEFSQACGLRDSTLFGFTFRVDHEHTQFSVFPVFKNPQLDINGGDSPVYEYLAVDFRNGLCNSWQVSPKIVCPFFKNN